MSLYGTVLVQYSEEYRKDLQKLSTNRAAISLDRIKNIPEVEEAWFVKEGSDADIIIRIMVDDADHAKKVEQEIRSVYDIVNVKSTIQKAEFAER